MKLFYTFFFLLICYQTYSQTEYSESDIRKMQKTYSFYLGQLFNINEIIENYPSYKQKAKSAQNLWNANFKTSIENIVSELESSLGVEFKIYEAELIKSMSRIDYSEITIEDIINTIDIVNNRASGDIPSPYLETLLTFNSIYRVQPEEEMIDGFINEYFTSTSTKLDGLNIKFKYPKSWSSEIGDRPHVIQKFIHYRGYEFGSALIIIGKMDDVLSKSDIEFLLSEDGMKYQIPEHSKVISVNTGLLIDNIPASLITVYYEQQQMNHKLGMISDIYVLYYRDYQITFMCSVGSTIDKYNETYKRYSTNKKLYKRMANNIVVLSQYE